MTSPLLFRTGFKEKSTYAIRPSAAGCVASNRTDLPPAASFTASRSSACSCGEWLHHMVSQNGFPSTSDSGMPAKSRAVLFTSTNIPSVVISPMNPNDWSMMARNFRSLSISASSALRRSVRLRRILCTATIFPSLMTGVALSSYGTRVPVLFTPSIVNMGAGVFPLTSLLRWNAIVMADSGVTMPDVKTFLPIISSRR